MLEGKTVQQVQEWEILYLITKYLKRCGSFSKTVDTLDKELVRSLHPLDDSNNVFAYLFRLKTIFWGKYIVGMARQSKQL
jgi:hypothetical protein